MPTHQSVAVVTGATGGMGREIVRELAQTHTVIALGRRQSALDDLAAIPHVAAVHCDVTDEAQVSDVAARLPRVDVLVHGAAVAWNMTLGDTDAGAWHRMFDVNVIAPALLTRALLPRLRQAQATVIFIGSGAGTNARAGNTPYSASKFALRAIADSFRQEEQTSGVRVVTLAPGPTDTDMLRGIIPPEDYRGDEYIRPETVAQAVRALVDLTPDAQVTDVALRPRRERVR